MIKSEIKPGKEYGFREKRGPGVPLQRVKVIEHVRGNKWKVERAEPNPGLRGNTARAMRERGPKLPESAQSRLPGNGASLMVQRRWARTLIPVKARVFLVRPAAATDPPRRGFSEGRPGTKAGIRPGGAARFPRVPSGT